LLPKVDEWVLERQVVDIIYTLTTMSLLIDWHQTGKRLNISLPVLLFVRLPSIIWDILEIIKTRQ
jgi:hypothetical protein